MFTIKFWKPSIKSLCLFNTDKCNFHCIHCSTNANFRKNKKLLRFEEKKEVLDQAKAMRLRQVILCGAGEPLLDQDFFPLVDYITELGMRPILVTNGSLIDEKAAHFLCDNGVEVRYKLESLNKKNFERLCGIKDFGEWVSFRHRDICIKIPESLKCLIEVYKEKGKLNKENVAIETIITTINYSEIPELACFCRDMNIGFSLKELRIAGKAKENLKELIVSKSQLDTLYAQISTIMGKRFVRKLRYDRCILRDSPFVAEDGEVIVCQSIDESAGNVRTKPLRKLFKQSQNISKKFGCNIKYYEKITSLL